MARRKLPCGAGYNWLTIHGFLCRVVASRTFTWEQATEFPTALLSPSP